MLLIHVQHKFLVFFLATVCSKPSRQFSDDPLFIYAVYTIIPCSPKHRFSDYMKGVEDIQAAEPKLILKRSPKEVSKLEQVH